MIRQQAQWLALTIALLSGLAATYAVTRGFNALTSDRGRQVALNTTPTRLPPLKLVDSVGGDANLAGLTSRGRYTVVSLVYTRCTTMCLLSASSGAFLQSRIRRLRLGARVSVLTISFDPARDTPPVLQEYGQRMRADPTIWRIATVADARDLRSLLDTFGLVVLPDGEGGYVHNGALFVVDPQGRLIQALDPDAPDEALAFVMHRLSS